MSDWLHNLPLIWMALVFAALLQAIIGTLGVGEGLRAFKAVSPGMLPPLGIIFGLFVAFTAAQVWSDNEHASAAVNREAHDEPFQGQIAVRPEPLLQVMPDVPSG